MKQVLSLFPFLYSSTEAGSGDGSLSLQEAAWMHVDGQTEFLFDRFLFSSGGQGVFLLFTFVFEM